MKNAVFWDVTPCGYCKNRRFGGTYSLLNRETRIGGIGTTLALTSNRRTLRRPNQSYIQEILHILLKHSRFIYLWGLSGTESTITVIIYGLLYQPWMTDDDCGEICRMKKWQGKSKYSEKTSPGPIRPPYIPRVLIIPRTRTTAVGIWGLTV
jgi:hypothetical protein